TIDLTVTGLSYKLEGLEVDDGGITRKARNVPISKARNVSKLKSTREGEEGEDDPITLTLTGLGTLTTLTELVVPDELHGIPVTAIANSAFQNNKILTSVTMGKNINTIGNAAFSNEYDNKGNITTLILNEGLEIIKSGAFHGSQVTNITLPSTLKIIEGSAFRYSSLIEVSLNEGLESVGGEAFSHQQIKKLVIPSTLKSMYGSSFVDNRIEEISIRGSNSWYTVNDNVLYTKDLKFLVLYPAGSSRTSFYIPNSVIKIVTYAFYSVPHLRKIWIPQNVKTMEVYAFYSIGVYEEITTIYSEVIEDDKPSGWDNKWFNPGSVTVEFLWGESRPN
ncbi:MAG: leucine-rich repeat domain-containing protein, partial [Treponemataceae bacterium]